MRVLITVAVLALLALSVSATHTFYTRSTAPKGWTKGDVASGHEGVEFMIALKQQNMDVLEKIFWEVSDPNHENYQNFMTPKQILAIVAPEHETVHTVKHWLKQHGATHIKDFGDALEIKTTVAIASKLFSTTFHKFEHEDGSMVIRQWGSYSVPLSIKKHVDMITGLSTFPVPHYNMQKPKSPMDNQGVIAQTLASIYQIRAEKPASSNSTSQGVIEFQGQNFTPDDLATYAQQCAIDAQVVSAANTIGPNDPTNPGTEAELDIQMMATVNIESTPWFWLEPGQGWLYPFGVHFSSTAKVPQVISISYGWWEGGQCDIAPDECSQLGVNSQVYVARVNTEFLKIGLRGVSILSATGDSGANGRTNEDCSVPQLRAAFPGSSPYLTGVGATQLNNPVYNLTNPPTICSTSGYPCPSGGQEVAVSYDVAGFASGGGFSSFTPMPDYQKTAVNAYLQSGTALPPSSYFNASGRAFPDVAAIGHNTLIYQGGVQPVGGTSASTPIFAAVVALLNEIAMDKTGKPLGFLNPLLYQAAANAPSVFHDITVGDNKCTESGCSSTCDGYLAAKGWDPVTGLGSPNVNKLAGYVAGHFDALAAKKHKKHHQHKHH